jgi:hypothetical protein
MRLKAPKRIYHSNWSQEKHPRNLQPTKILTNLSHQSTSLHKSQLILAKIGPMSQLFFLINLASFVLQARTNALELHQYFEKSSQIFFVLERERTFPLLLCTYQRGRDLADFVNLKRNQPKGRLLRKESLTKLPLLGSILV